MSIMAKTPSGYKNIGSAYLGERPVDKVFNANGDVVYALQRELTGVPPLLFKGKEQSELQNYRIYGDTVDGNGVGDLVESGEHAGEYKVPVTVEGINILPMSTTPISTDVDDFHCEYDGTGTITLTTDKDNAVLSSFSIPLSEDFIIPVSIGRGGDGCVQFNNSISASLNSNTDHICVSFYYNSTFIDSWGLTTINHRHSTYSSMGGKTINRVVIDIKGTGFSTNRKIVIRPAFVLNTTEQVPFEPYHAPVTTPIYLPEPIKMVGDEAEYIDYGEQKQHRVRKNLWSGVVEQGSVSTVGAYSYDIKRIRSKNVPIKPGAYTISCNLAIRCIYAYNNNEKVSCVVDNGGGAIYSNTFTVPSDANNVSIGLRSFDARGAEIDVTTSDFEWGQIEKGSEVTTYEPYIENTDLDVTLPALPIIKGTNTLSVDTEVQPSRMDIKGRIKTLT